MLLGYSKLIPLSGVIRLAKEAGIFISSGVLEECKKYVSKETANSVLFYLLGFCRRLENNIGVSCQNFCFNA